MRGPEEWRNGTLEWHHLAQQNCTQYCRSNKPKPFSKVSFFALLVCTFPLCPSSLPYRDPLAGQLGATAACLLSPYLMVVWMLFVSWLLPRRIDTLEEGGGGLPPSTTPKNGSTPKCHTPLGGSPCVLYLLSGGSNERIVCV